MMAAAQTGWKVQFSLEDELNGRVYVELSDALSAVRGHIREVGGVLYYKLIGPKGRLMIVVEDYQVTYLNQAHPRVAADSELRDILRAERSGEQSFSALRRNRLMRKRDVQARRFWRAALDAAGMPDGEIGGFLGRMYR